MATPKPHYPLKEVKDLLRHGHYDITPDAQQTARDDFNWGPLQIKECLLKLNDRFHEDDKSKNHFYKSAPHNFVPNTMMDFYKAVQIWQKFDVYTHFYIHPNDGKLVISSFKEL